MCSGHETRAGNTRSGKVGTGSGSSTGIITVGDSDCGGTVTAPVNPFLSNHYHFGMLLGVDDLETDQGYHRGKTWLHTSWLHAPGVAWGLGVSGRADRREIVVSPGLAITAAGREVYLDREHCVDIGRWLDEQAPESLEVDTDEEGGKSFDVHVVVGPRLCLERPVPAIATPCDGTDIDTAYSRNIETAQLRIEPNEPSEEDALLPYPKVRAFLGLTAPLPPDEPADGDSDGEDDNPDGGSDEIADALAEIAGLAPAERGAARVAWLRRFAADDVIALEPHRLGALFRAPEDEGVLLATVHVRLSADGTMIEDETRVDNRVRPSHIATSTIQELVAHCCDDAIATTNDEGPRADATSVALDDKDLTFEMNAPLDATTVTKDAFTVTTLTESGWVSAAIDSVAVENDVTVHLTLDEAITTRPVRVIGAGTGPNPLLGTDGRPVAGVLNGPPASEHDGHDIVLMVRS